MSSEGDELEDEVDTLPIDWQLTTLGGVLAKSEGGGTPPREVEAYWNGDIPWASVKDVVKGEGATPEEMITSDGLANSTSKLIPAGTNIFAARMGVGAVVRYPFSVAINQDLIALTPSSALDPGYLFYWLQARKDAFVAVATGTTVKGIRKDVLLSFPMVLPPLEEQRRIAEVLRSVDEAIATTDTLLSGVKATKQGAMEAVLSGGFTEVRLETLLADTRYPMRSGPFGSALLKSELRPEGVPFLGIDNVHVERFVPIYRRFVSEDKFRELARYRVYPGDVMVTIMGTVGRCCVVPSDIGTAISSKHVWTLTLDQARYSPALLAWQVNHSPAVLAQLRGSAQGGIMSAISSGTLRNLPVPLPSPDEVKEIENLLFSFNAEIDDLEAELKQYRTTKAALMSDLLSGRVRVPE
nr:restriction endonuclease subunit S [uncultured Sphingomonas sp.]